MFVFYHRPMNQQWKGLEGQSAQNNSRKVFVSVGLTAGSQFCMVSGRLNAFTYSLSSAL